jgi:putative FmdB family regulatory protein
MPTYEMRCNNEDCKHEFEVFQKSSAKAKLKCPACGKMKLERLISACYGHVAATQGDMKTIGDLANFNRDNKSKGEKQAADQDYAGSSRLATEKLRQDKEGVDHSFFGASETDMTKIGKLSEKKQKDYIATGKL